MVGGGGEDPNLKFKFCLCFYTTLPIDNYMAISAACCLPHTCISMGVKGVRGVPGKLLPPIVEGVLGMDPERLRGGLKSDIGVGGADPIGELAPPGERTAGLLLLPRWGDPFPLSSLPPLAAWDPCADEGAAAGAPGAGEASAVLPSEFDRAGEEGGGCVGSSVLLPAIAAESPAAPPSDGGEVGLDDICFVSCHCYSYPMRSFRLAGRLIFNF